jgi:hypothetical protein
MHSLSTSFVLGYHGCRNAVAEKLLAGHAFEPSDNAYDWLGPGVYFWESDPRRGLDFIREKARRDGFDPSDGRVVGAVVDLGACLDLTTSGSMALLKVAYDDLTRLVCATGIPMPTNLLHAILDIAEISPVQSVKGVFTEGRPIYPGSGIPEKTHIQIAVCDPSCIKGVFRVRSRDLN